MRRATTNSGWTLVELLISLGAWSLFLTTTVGAILGAQRVFIQSELTSDVQLRAQRALERIIAVTSNALSVESEFSPLYPVTGVGSRGLCFRPFDSLSTEGDALYENNIVFLCGPEDSTYPSRGMIIGRGPDFATIHQIGSGADGFLGTVDDDTNTSVGGGVPAVELLIPATFAPRSGEMLTVDVSPAPKGRLLQFTLRLNARTNDGFLFPNDLVLTERLALRR